jgi:hypothetical protein
MLEVKIDKEGKTAHYRSGIGMTAARGENIIQLALVLKNF